MWKTRLSLFGFLASLLFFQVDCGEADEPDQGCPVDTSLLQLTLTASRHAGPGPLTVTFGAVVAGSSGTVSYAWSFGDGETSTEQSPTHTYPDEGQYTASLVVTDAMGRTKAGGVSITVLAEPDVELTASAAEGPAPLTVTLDCANSAWPSIIGYRWEFGDGQTSTQQETTHTYHSPGSYVATCTTLFEDAEASGSIPIEVTQNTVPQVTVAADPVTGAAPLEVQFQSSVSGGEGTITYDWAFGDSSENATVAAPLHTFTAAGLYLVALTVTDGDGDASRQVLEIRVLEDLQATVVARADVDQGVSPLEVYFTADTSGGNPPLAYDWDFGDGTAHSVLGDPTHTYVYQSSTPTYTATLIVTDADGDTASSTVSIAVEEDQPVVLTVTADIQTGTAPLRVVFGKAVTSANGEPTCTWNFGDGTQSGELQPTHTYTKAGVFDATCYATDLDGDTAVASIPITVTLPEAHIVVGSTEVDSLCAVPLSLHDQSATPIHLEVAVAEEQSLTVRWSFFKVPSGSRVAFADATAANTTFVPDLHGTYRIAAIASDGLYQVSSNVLEVEASAAIEIDIAEPAPAIADEPVDTELAEPLEVELTNGCGAPVPSYPVRWYGDNAGIEDPFTITDAVGLAVNYGYTSVYAGDGSITATLDWVYDPATGGSTRPTADFDFEVLPGPLAYLVMGPTEPTMVGTDTCVDITFHLGDVYGNPLTYPDVEFDLELKGGTGPQPWFDLPPVGGEPVTVLLGEETVGGESSVTVCHTIAELVQVVITDVEVIEGPDAGDLIEGLGEWIVYADDFETYSGWTLAQGEQWEVGVPENVGPEVGPDGLSAVSSVLGTVTEGNYLLSESTLHQVYRTIRVDPRIQALRLTLEFWHWYDMGGDFVCPTSAIGDVSAADLLWFTPANQYPGPTLCDARGFWGFGASSHGWRRAYFDLGAPESYYQDGLDLYFNFYTTDDRTAPTGPGWYIDDLTIRALTSTGLIQFVAEDTPAATGSILLEQGGHRVSATCTHPWVVETTIQDQYGNQVFKPEVPVEFSFSNFIGGAPDNSPEIVEVVRGTFVSETEGVTTVETDWDGAIVLKVDNPVSEQIVLEASLGGTEGLSELYIDFRQSMRYGDCCENAMNVSLTGGSWPPPPYSNSGFMWQTVAIPYLGQYTYNDQIQECGLGEGHPDYAITFGPYGEGYYEDRFTRGWYFQFCPLGDFYPEEFEMVAEIRVLDGPSTAESCPGNLVYSCLVPLHWCGEYFDIHTAMYIPPGVIPPDKRIVLVIQSLDDFEDATMDILIWSTS